MIFSIILKIFIAHPHIVVIVKGNREKIKGKEATRKRKRRKRRRRKREKKKRQVENETNL